MNQTAHSCHPKYVSADGVFLTAEWQHLAMLNYEVDAGLLLPFTPAGTELDRWNEQIFVSLVGFRFLKTRLRGIPADSDALEFRGSQPAVLRATASGEPITG